MKKYITNAFVIVSFLFATLVVQTIYTQSYIYAQSSEYHADQSWIIRWIDEKDEQILSKSEVIEEYADFNISVLRPNQGENIHLWLSSLNASSHVQYFQVNHTVEVSSAPNDEFISQQSYLANIGAVEAWDITNENTAIKIAIVDTGIDLHHPDLIDNLVEGINILDESVPPQDDNGHGTNVAGIVGASGNNVIGVSGILWNAQIMPIKALDEQGKGNETDLGEGIQYAVENGAQIVVLSLGLHSASPYLQEIVQYAENHGVLVVAASGNDGQHSIQYPAAYPTVLAVGGLYNDKTIPEKSNFGQEIDVVAPWKVYTTGLGGSYTYNVGTSMAAPQVAAAAALIWSQYPELEPAQIRNLIRQTAEDVYNSGWDEHTGYGLLRVDSALVEPAIEDIYEDNNSKDEAKPLQMDAMMTGALTGESDEDWFYLDSLYDGNLKFEFESTLTGEVDVVDVELIYHFNEEVSVYDLSQPISLPVKKDQKGYIQLRYKDQTNHDLLPYEFTSQFVIEADLYEDNDTQATAFVLPETGENILGTFHQDSDKDWYVLEVVQEGNLRIELSTDTNRMDPQLILQKPDGTSLFIDRGNAGEAEFYSGSVLPGKYYFQVQNYEEEGMESLPIIGNYLFQVTYLPTFVDANEPNDKAYQTTKLDLNIELNGVFDHGTDEDWFSFSIDETSDISIDLGQLPQDRNVTLSVLNSTQSLVFLTTNEGQTNINKQLEGLNAGTYYVKLASDQAFDYQMYSLKVTERNIDTIFTDIETHWAKEEIKELWEQGVVNGVDGRFLPNENITRAEAITMVVRAMELTGVEPTSSPFIDITNKYWAYEPILLANQAGLISGYTDGTFAPNDNLNRVEAAKIIANALDIEGVEGEIPFSDIPQGYWASGILTQLKLNGIISGYNDGTFRPENETSRAEFATLIYNLLLD
ncbi:S8 family serine peptidase [Chengkuizengella sediminis]|uniref:S8 family serine peptidase n=1 Tax=Chengkuizengella sediminis TaxID=1885917 RepID=UPI00138A174A|nr:S8 family serine peptidase [Chengkuizengella sediminis]NDI36824.1 S8 family serine peptidase [Chengkuizengella sediminis]